MKIKIAPIAELDRKKAVLFHCIAVASALLASALIMLCLKLNPIAVYSKIVSGSLGTFYRFQQTVHKAIPLTMLSLGIGIAFKMKFWNIGAEGQFFMGAFASAAVAFAIPNCPRPALLLFMGIAGFLAGGLFALIPAFFKIKFSTSETLVTLMLNYVAQKFVAYLQYGPWRDPAANGFPKIANFSNNAVLPKLFGIHIGWIIVLIVAAILFVILKRTKLGYEIEVLGESEATARYAGINVPKVLVISILISGGLCGVAGFMQASAIEKSISEYMSSSLGFTAVITSWLSGLDPILTVGVSFMFSMLIQGGTSLQAALQIPAAMSQILQGIIIFFVLGSEFFLRYKFVVVREDKK